LPSAEEKLDELDAVFAALDHPARRRILMLIRFRGGEMAAGDIAGRFHVAWPTITRHLRVLETAGLVVQKREGRQRVYRLVKKKLVPITEWISWFDEVHDESGEPEPKGTKKTR
jgi:DNA-binding transcriptional ArsR family regulator